MIAKESQAASGFNDSTNVTIFVLDLNEYNPVFDQLSYSATVNGTLRQGTPVIQVNGFGLAKIEGLGLGSSDCNDSSYEKAITKLYCTLGDCDRC